MNAIFFKAGAKDYVEDNVLCFSKAFEREDGTPATAASETSYGESFVSRCGGPKRFTR